MHSTHEVVEYSEQCMQGSLSSCSETIDDHHVEERFEIYSQESKTEFVICSS